MYKRVLFAVLYARRLLCFACCILRVAIKIFSIFKLLLNMLHFHIYLVVLCIWLGLHIN